MFKSSHFLVGLGCAGVLSLASSAMAQTCYPNVATAKPSTIYQDNGDGTVTDTRTELIWQKCSLGQSGADCSGGSAQTYNWAGALKAAQQANADELLGHKDWRLPSIAELGTLIEESCYSPAINESVFPNTKSAEYWSASPHADNGSNNAWFVNFDLGYESSYDKYIDNYVRLVRGGQ